MVLDNKEREVEVHKVTMKIQDVLILYVTSLLCDIWADSIGKNRVSNILGSVKRVCNIELVDDVDAVQLKHKYLEELKEHDPMIGHHAHRYVL